MRHEPRTLFLATWVSFVGLLPLVGCTGAIGEAPLPGPAPTPLDPATMGGPGGSGGGGTGGAPVAPSSTEGLPTSGETPLHRLTAREYRNTLADAFPGLSLPDLRLPADDDERQGEMREAKGLVTESHLTAYLDAAEAVGARVAETANRRLAPCPVGMYEPCLAEFAQKVGARLYRRALTDAEVGRLQASFREAGGGDAGVAHVVARLLASPHFLYRIERGEEATAGQVRVDDPALAARLSYFLWRRPPDDRLLGLATRGALRTRATLEGEVRRMLADTRAAEGLFGFVSHWLHLEKVEEVAKDPGRFPQWNERLRAAALEEASAFVGEVIGRHEGSLAMLFGGDFTFVGDDTATLYGLPRPGTRSAIRTALPADGPRAGIFTQAAFLAGHANSVEGSVVHRGLTIREELFCDRPPPPPPGVEADVVTDRLTTATCASCHTRMDPIGDVFARFDAIGRDLGERAARKGAIAATLDADGTYDGPRALAQALAKSGQVRACTARQVLRAAMGRPEIASDGPLLGRMERALGRGLVPAVTELLLDPAFGIRHIEPATGCQ